MDDMYREMIRFYILPMLINRFLDEEEMPLETIAEKAGANEVYPTEERKSEVLHNGENAETVFLTENISNVGVCDSFYTANDIIGITKGGDITDIYENTETAAADIYGDVRQNSENNYLYDALENVFQNTVSEVYMQNLQNGSIYENAASFAYRTETTENENISGDIYDISNTDISNRYTEKMSRTSADRLVSENNSYGGTKNEFVINLGGITQNISGEGGTDMQKIGDAVAQCIINAINTTAEGAF